MDKDMKQALISVGIVVAETVAFYYIFRLMSNPDTLTTIRMKMFKSVESTCMRNATGWANASEVASRLYDQSRAVV